MVKRMFFSRLFVPAPDGPHSFQFRENTKSSLYLDQSGVDPLHLGRI